MLLWYVAISKGWVRWWWLVGVSSPWGALCLHVLPCEHHGCGVVFFSVSYASAEMPDASESCFY